MKLDRSDEIDIVKVDHGHIKWEEDGENLIPVFYGEDCSYPVSLAAIDTLLNMVKVPIKYFWRVAEVDNFLAQQNINLWLKDAEDVGGLIHQDKIVQFFDSRRLFLPASLVRQTVGIHLGVDDRLIFDTMDGETYVGTFPIPHSQHQLFDGSSVHLYIRILFSDCFEIVPRIDLAVTYDKTFESFYVPVKGRKLRISGQGPSQVLNQITEFVDLVMEQGMKEFLPALDDAIKSGGEINPLKFNLDLCNHLRLSRKIGSWLIDDIEPGDRVSFLKQVGSRLMPEVRPDMIDLQTARLIEIAISNYLIAGNFK